MTKLINLKESYGHKYRIDYERDIDDKPLGRSPEYMQLRSKRGHVYVHSATHLGFATKKRTRVFSDIPEMKLIQDGVDGQNFIFKVEDFDKLVSVLKLYRKRKVSPAERNRLLKMSQAHGFKKNASMALRSGSSESAKKKKGIPAASEAVAKCGLDKSPSIEAGQNGSCSSDGLSVEPTANSPKGKPGRQTSFLPLIEEEWDQRNLLGDEAKP